MINGRTLLLVHFLVCSIGLLKIIHFLAHVIFVRSDVRNIAATLFYFFSEYSYFDDKPAELLQYGLSVPALFFHYALAWLAVQRLVRGEPHYALEWILSRQARLWGFLSLILVINVGVFLRLGRQQGYDVVLLLSGVWLVVLLLPIAELLFKSIWKRLGTGSASKALTKLQSWLLLLLSVQILTIFGQYVVGPLRVANDYMDIPEYTQLDGRYVNNTTYINEHALGGLNKYEPALHAGRTPPPRPGTFVDIMNDELTGFVAVNKPRRFGEPLSEERQPATRDTRYHYDTERGRLALRDRMTGEERAELLGLATSTAERSLVSRLYQMSAANAMSAESRRYSPEELKFFELNRIELTAQAKAGWFFHHHNAMLAPINALSLGKPASEIHAQYGWLNAIVLNQLVEWAGKMSFENYFSALYAVYPLYLALLLFTAWVLLRDIYYVLVVAILSFSATLVLGQEILRIAPGFNPIRHFFDIPVLLCMYFYGTRNKILYLALAVLLAGLAILCSREFGLFVMTALIATLAVKQVLDGKHRSRLEWVLGGLALAATWVGLNLVKTPEDSVLVYSLIGVSAPSFQSLSLYTVLFLLSILYIPFIGALKREPSWREPFVFLFLYCQGITIYYVWYSMAYHLLALVPVWALLLAMLLKNALESEPLRRHQQRIRSAFIAALMLVYIPGLVFYYLHDFEYRRIFETHRVYRWNFDRAKFETTMDPAYFENGVELIRRYSPPSGIFIVSKYDTLLPFLAGRYSAMPYPDVATSLVTQREVDQCINAIRTARPLYLFIDTDIERNLNGDIWLKADPLAVRNRLYSESFARVSVLNLLKRVYAGIRKDYEPFEKGALITVYRRKNT